jgi:hypothetical protein
MIPGKKINEAISEDVIVVKSMIPNLFNTADLQVIRTKEAKQEVVAPPKIVEPMFLKAYSILCFLKVSRA